MNQKHVYGSELSNIKARQKLRDLRKKRDWGGGRALFQSISLMTFFLFRGVQLERIFIF